MSPEEKELLKRSVALAEDNNLMLRSMQRSLRISRIISLIYWVLIIGSAVGAFYIIQPYMNQVIGVYDKASGILNSLK